MPSLAELQRHMVHALLRGEDAALAPLLAPSPISTRRAIDAHRQTVFAGLANALRLSMPTVDWLVGSTFFDQAARDYAQACRSIDVLLERFIAAFPDFMTTYAPAAGLPYIADVARFDLALAEARRAAPRWRRTALQLDAQTSLVFNRGLEVITTNYRLDEIRAAYETLDQGALSEIDMHSRRRWFAVWRSHEGVRSKELLPASAVFLEHALAGHSADASLNAALADVGPEIAPDTGLQHIQSQVFAAPFTRVRLKPVHGDLHARAE